MQQLPDAFLAKIGILMPLKKQLSLDFRPLTQSQVKISKVSTDATVFLDCEGLPIEANTHEMQQSTLLLLAYHLLVAQCHPKRH